MKMPAGYSARSYELPPELLQKVLKLNPTRTYGELALIWAEIIALVWIGRFVIPAPYFWVGYVPIIFLIAGRMGAILQVLHEAAHGLVAPSDKVNQRVGHWLCALPLGISYYGYTSGHVRHHAFLGTEKDPPSDREKYLVGDSRKPTLYLLFLKDLLGITALQVFFSYKENDEAQPQSKQKQSFFRRHLYFFQMALVQIVILSVLFQLKIGDYLLFWIVPAVSPHMFLMRIRGIAEHGLFRQIDAQIHDVYDGNYYTRSFMTSVSSYQFKPFAWFEQMMIGSLSVHYHHEHHLFPKVPFYNLKHVHEAIGEKVVEKNPDIYAKGYFSAAFRNLFGFQ